MKKSNIRCYYEYRLKRAKSENKHCFNLIKYFVRFADKVKCNSNASELYKCCEVSKFLIKSITNILEEKQSFNELDNIKFFPYYKYFADALDGLFEIVEKNHKRIIDIINEFESEYENKEK